MLCPRRAESPVHTKFMQEEDSWRPDNTCSYCGSYHPDKLMERLRNGDVELGPTDKNYKVYLTNKGGEPFLQTYRTDSKPFQGYGSSEHDWVTRETMGKFYFMHLSIEQQDEFIQLVNDKKVHIGYPGYFYNLPYFCKAD